MARPLDRKTGCSLVALIILFVALLAVVGFYYVWRVENSVGYTAPVPAAPPS